MNGPLRVGIGGPVGAGKTTLTEGLARVLAHRCSMAVITNDIYTREDASINLAAVTDLNTAFPDLDLVLIESGGDNLAATFSPELVDLTIYVIDTAAGQDIPRKRGPGLTKSDILVVNKIDLAPQVGVDLARLEADTAHARGARPYVLANLRKGDGLDQIIRFIQDQGGLRSGLMEAVERSGP